MCPLMKVWFESMRNAGHRTLQADVLREWEFAARLFVEKLEAKVRGGAELSCLEKERQR